MLVHLRSEQLPGKARGSVRAWGSEILVSGRVVTLMRDVIHSHLVTIRVLTLTCRYFYCSKNGNELYQYVIHSREVSTQAHEEEGLHIIASSPVLSLNL